MTTTFSFNDFSDRELLSEVSRLAASEREAAARLVASLADVDATAAFSRDLTRRSAWIVELPSGAVPARPDRPNNFAGLERD
jgi:hypothetical protein